MKPIFTLAIDGTDRTALFSDRVVSLTVTDEDGMKSDRVSIVLDDRDNALSLPRKGAEVRIGLGYEETGIAYMGDFTVDQVEPSGPPDRIKVTARAAKFRQSLKAPKTRNWTNVTLGDLVKTIAAEHGYEPKIADALAGVSIAQIDQTEESDIHLLTRLSGQHGAVAKPAAGRLLFVPRGQVKSASGKLLTPVALTRENLTTWHATLPDRGRYLSVTAYWHNPATGARVTETAGAGQPVFTIRHGFPTPEDARTAAASKFDALNRKRATLSLTLPGDPAIAAEAPLVVSGVREGVNGTWIVTSCKHVFNGSTYTTSLEAEAK